MYVNTAAFILIVITNTPLFNGTNLFTRTPSISMQEFGSEQACIAAKEVIEGTVATSREGRTGDPYWAQGYVINTFCQPKG